jgi:hypothetical protein
MQTSDSHSSFVWLIFSLITVICWGVYGVLLHSGQIAMSDAINGRYKAFLFVGIAYFLSGVLAPVAVLALNGAGWKFPVAGMCWSLAAGIAGAVGAFCVLLSFGAQGSPAAVMAIVFGGAPIVNAIVALLMHPPAEGWGALRWQFFLGIALAAIGGCLVTLYKPVPAKEPPPVVSKAE